MSKQLYSFYSTTGEKLIPSWFKLDVEQICDELLGGVGDFGDPESINEVVQMYSDDNKDYYHEMGVFITNLMIRHCTRNIPEEDTPDMLKMTKDFNKLYRYHLAKIEEAYISWDTSKNNLKRKKQ